MGLCNWSEIRISYLANNLSRRFAHWDAHKALHPITKL
jgi:hypothetical protein